MTAHSDTIRLGFSPCPNDTFMFHDLVHGVVPFAGPPLNFELLDIEALNRAALQDPPAFEVTKLSLPALAHRIEDYSILAAGAALGRGCGPLVVTPTGSALQDLSELAGCRVAIPGAHTTAFLLMKIFAPAGIQPVEMRFDEILPAVANQRVDAGLIIHESRFTYPDHGLRALADLGEVWEQATDLPLPLGVIAARRSLGNELVHSLEQALSQSVRNAFEAPARVRPWIRQHAQELDDEVCDQHIALYVNEFSVDLGTTGHAAIEALLNRGRAVGHLPSGGSPWRESGA